MFNEKLHQNLLHGFLYKRVCEPKGTTMGLPWSLIMSLITSGRQRMHFLVAINPIGQKAV
jgi:hypothetical protein